MTVAFVVVERMRIKYRVVMVRMYDVRYWQTKQEAGNRNRERGSTYVRTRNRGWASRLQFQ